MDELTRDYQLHHELTIRQLIQDFCDNYPHSDMADVGGSGYEERLAVFDLHPTVYDTLIDGFDICVTPLPRPYQTIICCNTFEHLIDPVRAAENIVKSLKKGGYVFITTLFAYPKHDYDGVIDTYRYTDSALSILFKGLEEKKCWFENESQAPGAIRVSYIGTKK